MRYCSNLRALSVAAGLGLAALGTGPGRAQTADWQPICDASGCRMAQSLLTADGQQPVMTARVFTDPQPTLLLSLPLGIFLKPGLTLQIDDGPAEAHSFEICDANGCHAGIALDDTMLARLRRGNVAYVAFQDSERQPIRLPISLAGFTAGLQKILPE